MQRTGHEDLSTMLAEKGLKVTPQRIAVLQAMHELSTHPTAEKIKEFVRSNHPSVAIGTVYKILETFVEHGLVNKVKTDRDVMRYDAVMENHHHLYCNESDRIEDYSDDELNNLLQDYFSKKEIPGFEIKDIRLQLIGKFSDDPAREKTN